jgi:hypothetical protein
MKNMKKSILKHKKLVTFFVPLVIVALIAGVMAIKIHRDKLITLKTKTIPEIVTKLVGDPSVKLKDVANLRSESGVYAFDLNLDYSGTAKSFPSYMTKDGQLFFTTAVKVSDILKTAAATPNPTTAKTLTCSDINKSATPTLTAFLVSTCPYGLQMQRVMAKAIAEQPALQSSLNVKYIGSIENGKITSMHGDAEAQENLRQICIREEQKDLYWPYVSCFIQAGNSVSCLAQTGVNTANVTACMADAKRGNTYAQKDFDEMNKYSIGSSPTLLVNDSQVVSEFDFGGRIANALKTITCCASTNQPGFCSTDLSKDEVATSFSTTGTAATGSGTAAANCGN